VRELVEGRTLAERLAGGLQPLDEVRVIALQIAAALDAASQRRRFTGMSWRADRVSAFDRRRR
jgi:hypothetical protein